MNDSKTPFGLRAALTDVFAGTVCSVLSIAYCLSYAALIFTGPLDRFLSYGIAVTFLSAAIGGSIVALRSSLTFAVAEALVDELVVVEEAELLRGVRVLLEWEHLLAEPGGAAATAALGLHAI